MHSDGPWRTTDEAGLYDGNYVGGVTLWEKVALWCIPLGVIALVVVELRW